MGKTNGRSNMWSFLGKVSYASGSPCSEVTAIEWRKGLKRLPKLAHPRSPHKRPVVPLAVSCYFWAASFGGSTRLGGCKKYLPN